MNEITGTLQRQKLFGSRYVNPRTVDVWLPPAYDPAQRHAVLYMHDGQNLFDPTLAYGGMDWGMDETISRMTATGELPPLIWWACGIQPNAYRNTCRKNRWRAFRRGRCWQSSSA
ncbi:MAG TPA: hypothetical protein PLA25_11145, partial [Anaerolineaceae bacterium]|nr:hypothetical protein [Anaerolineaceae bacterium]